jgi:hypothetical protein
MRWAEDSLNKCSTNSRMEKVQVDRRILFRSEELLKNTGHAKRQRILQYSITVGNEIISNQNGQ